MAHLSYNDDNSHNEGVAAMEKVGHVRLVLARLLAERSKALPRTARRFLEILLSDELLLGRMRFCRSEERAKLKNSVLISCGDAPCWGVMLGNAPEAGRSATADRARLAVEGLSYSIDEVLHRLRTLPVWFLAVDPEYAFPDEAESIRIENTIYRMARADARGLRRQALMDQVDAALDDGDQEAYHRLCELLRVVG